MGTLTTTVSNLIRRLRGRWSGTNESEPRLLYTPPVPMKKESSPSDTVEKVTRMVAKGAILLLLVACGEPEPDPCPNDLTWENFGESFIHQYCTACHSSTVPETHRNDAPPEVNLDSYAGVLRWVDHIDAASTTEPVSMPPGGGPTSAEIALLGEWIDCTVRDEAYRAEGL